ncbi:MAG: hypothetical protein IJN55_04975 [Alistipes sp.]|nr:hypothetical protein [Alistipes sp.]
MQRRRYIAMLLAAVYLWTVGGMAFALLYCPCQSHHAKSPCCEGGCHHVHQCAPQNDCLHYTADCYCDRHANTQILYTYVGDDEVRRMVSVLLVTEALYGEPTVSDGWQVAVQLDRAGPPILPLLAGYYTARSLRAPPVMA